MIISVNMIQIKHAGRKMLKGNKLLGLSSQSVPGPTFGPKIRYLCISEQALWLARVLESRKSSRVYGAPVGPKGIGSVLLHLLVISATRTKKKERRKKRDVKKRQSKKNSFMALLFLRPSSPYRLYQPLRLRFMGSRFLLSSSLHSSSFPPLSSSSSISFSCPPLFFFKPSR